MRFLRTGDETGEWRNASVRVFGSVARVACVSKSVPALLGLLVRSETEWSTSPMQMKCLVAVAHPLRLSCSRSFLPSSTPLWSRFTLRAAWGVSQSELEERVGNESLSRRIASFHPKHPSMANRGRRSCEFRNYQISMIPTCISNEGKDSKK